MANGNERPHEPEVNRKAVYILVAIAIVIIIAVVAIVLGTSEGDENKNSGTDMSTAVTTEVYTPTFKYFVESTDENYAEYMAVVDELKAQYDGRVNFDIVDITVDTEATKNFPVTSENTPFLIMLNTENNPSTIEGSCVGKERLIDNIEAAME